MKTTQLYVAKDGKEFRTKEECMEHEKLITPEKITITTWVWRADWSVYEKLVEMWYQFNDKAASMLRFALNELDIEIEVDSKTGEVKILRLK